MANAISSTIKKAKYTKKIGEDSYQNYHLETDTDQVLVETAIGEVNGAQIATGETLQSALKKINKVSAAGGAAAVTLANHIKQSNPHGTTKGDVGLGNVVNAPMDDAPTSGSNNYVKSGGVYSAIASANELTATAQAKADSAYDLANGRSAALVFTSVANLIAGKWTHGSTTEAVTLNDFKIGDSVFITTSKVSDFWISSISAPLVNKDPSTEEQINAAKDGQSVIVSWANKYVTLVAVETKTDLSSYLTSSSAANTYVKKSDYPVFTGDVTGTGTYANGIKMTLSQTGVEEGTYSAVTVDKSGRATAGYQMVAFADGLDDTSLDNLAIGGIAVIENS